ncbi:MAG: nucleotidyltransferase domain-containing protein [Deltaproteobacteria bacterium]|nr:nucleotidyltransferase domain-containing protein [Deltaproteobacteria bacterium]
MTSAKKIADTPNEIIEDILKRLMENYAPLKVILFGSYAYGTPRKGSDIDLLIIKETSDRFIDRWTQVRRILSDPKRLIPLETLVMTPGEIEKRLAIGDQFLDEILRKGKVLYAA